MNKLVTVIRYNDLSNVIGPLGVNMVLDSMRQKRSVVDTNPDEPYCSLVYYSIFSNVDTTQGIQDIYIEYSFFRNRENDSNFNVYYVCLFSPGDAPDEVLERISSIGETRNQCDPETVERIQEAALQQPKEEC